MADRGDGRTREAEGAAMVLLAATLWGSSGLFVSYLSGAGLTTPQFTAVRCVSAYVVVLAICLVRDRRSLTVSSHDVPWLILNGAVGIFAFTLLYAMTIQLTGMAVAAVLIYLMPSIVFVYEVLRHRERVTTRRVACLVLSLLGCALVSGLLSPETHVVVAGVVFGIASAFAYATNNLTQAGPLKRYPGTVVVAHSLGVAALLSCVYVFLTDGFYGAFAVYAAHPEVLVVNVALGVCGSVVTYLLYNGALHRMPASQVALLATFEPVSAAIMGAVFLGQGLSLPVTLGIASEVLALVLTQRVGPGRGFTPRREAR